MAKTRTTEKMSAHGPGARALAISIIASAVLGLYISSLGYQHPSDPYPIQTVDTAMQNIGVVLLVLELILAYGLKYIQQGTYWFFWLQLKKTSLDERQRAVRQQVFERAYAYSLIIVLLVVDNITSMANYHPDVRNSLTTRVIAAAGIILIALPSILAAFKKDS
jgi:hypothetical protein